MAKNPVAVTWMTEETFDVSIGSHHFMIDSPPQGRASRGPSPLSLALAGLAGCTAMDVISILQKQRQAVTGLVVRVDGDRAADHPRRYTRIEVTYELRGRNLSPQAVQRAVALSDEKYCSVTATFRQPTEVVNRIVLLDEAAEAEDAPPGAAPA